MIHTAPPHCVDRWMFWADAGSSPKIEKASMDGTSRTVLHSTGLSTPTGVTVDYETQTIYWIDYSLNKIEKSFVNGSNRITLTSASSAPLYITFLRGKLYWTDYSSGRLYTTSSDLTSSASLVSTTSFSYPWGIEAMSKERQPQGT